MLALIYSLLAINCFVVFMLFASIKRESLIHFGKLEMLIVFGFIILSTYFYILLILQFPARLIATILSVWAIYLIFGKAVQWLRRSLRFSSLILVIFSILTFVFVLMKIGWFPGLKDSVAFYFFNLPTWVRATLFGGLIGYLTNCIAIFMIGHIVVPMKKEKLATGIGIMVKTYVSFPIVNEFARWIAENKVRNEDIGQTIRNIIPMLKAEIQLVEYFGGALGAVVGFAMVYFNLLR